MTKNDDWLNAYLNKIVVVDMDSGHILIGELLDFGAHHLVLSQADLHDSSRANSTKEVYLIEASQYGINVNRKEVAIPRNRFLAISKLEDTEIN